jgi:hypothetical protein
LEKALVASSGKQPAAQAAADLWAAEIAFALSSFIYDARAAIAAA